MDAKHTPGPMRPPAVKSPGAIRLTKEAALATVHSLDATPQEHDDALDLLTQIARRELALPGEPS